jgi:glycosyltransferase involved in cell wall biosynthesis
LRSRFFGQSFPLNVTLRGNLLPLKVYDPQTGEKGVLILTYSYLFRAFHSLFQTEKMRQFYWVILEPSGHQLEDPGFTLYGGWSVVLQARNPVITRDLQVLGPLFETVPLNAGDWVDFDTFRPLPGLRKVYDLIMIADWSRNKQHDWLFRTLARMERPLRVALVGTTWERRRDAIEAEIRKYGVGDQIEIFQGIPAAEVNRVLNLSRVNLMLSRFELANRALHEAMFANVPTIAYRSCEGLDLTFVNEQTGVLVGDDELAEAILDVLGRTDQFSPRAWAMEHTGYARSTRILNDRLKECSLARGEPWTKDIATKVNRPSLCYKFEQDAERLRSTLDHLAQFLRPDRR